MATQVQTQYIADSAVTTAKINNGAITSAKLDAGVMSGVLATKVIGKWVLTAEQSSPGASTLDVKTLLGFGTTAGVDPEGASKGKAVLLEAAGGAEFNTTSGLVGASAVMRSSKCQIVDANGDAIVSASGDEVWGVITASARTTGGTYTLRFFSGEFGSGSETAYTMSQAFKFTYPQIFDLSDMPQWSDERATLVDKDAAQIAPGQIGATELASDAVTTVKILDSNVTTAKIADGAVTGAKIGVGEVAAINLASDAVTTAKILASNVTYAKIQNVSASDRLLGRSTSGAGALEEITVGGDISQSGSTFTIGAGAVTETKVASAFLLRLAETLLEDSVSTPTASAAKGFIDGSSGEGLVEALAVPGMAVRIQTAGTAYNHLGKRLTLPTTTSLAVTAADVTNPRKDIVVLDTSGTLAVRAGTPAGSPSDPTLTAGDVPLARIAVAALAVTIGASDITDLRERNAIDGSKLQTGSVATAKLADSAVTTAKIADSNVTAGKIASDAVTTVKILDSNVTAAKLASDAVTTVKILDANVTQAKLASAVVSRIGGGWDAVEYFNGDDSTVNFDLAFNDVDGTDEKILITVDGLVMIETDDYSFSGNGGAGGVDRIVMVSAPPTGSKLVVRYRRTSI